MGHLSQFCERDSSTLTSRKAFCEQISLERISIEISIELDYTEIQNNQIVK